MAGNREGGHKAAATNQERHGDRYAEFGGFYGYIGSLGGSTVTPKTKLKGFGSRPELASAAGKKGGATSVRSR